MFELIEDQYHQASPQPTSEPVRYSPHSEIALLRTALNQVDYGLVAVDADTAALQFANCPGRSALEGRLSAAGTRQFSTGLRIVDGCVTTCRDGHGDSLRTVLQRTKAGLRGFLSLGSGDQAASVAVVPLTPAPVVDRDTYLGRSGAIGGTSYALLVFAKQHLCDDSTVAMFARDRGLTNAEGQVLAQVCKGLRPSEIADQQGVQISTVRTQLRSIRIKTGSDTIRQLVGKVSILPPMARQWSAVNSH